MELLTFVDTHNMIAFLTKSDASEGFNQIVDFLNAHTIQYALMFNPPIYVSCIKQFWASVSIKKSNDVVKLQALIDRKKVIITDDTIRQNHRLDDADGIDCLPNEEIFVELARMRYEKPSTKLTFYKAFFSAQWKFLIHTLVQYDLSSHNTKYTSHALIQKVFANIRRIGKGFLGVDTPLSDAIHVQPDSKSCSLRTRQSCSSFKDYQAQAEGLKVGEEEKIQIFWFKEVEEGRKTVELDADEDVTLVDVDAEVGMDTNIQGRMAESQAKAYNLDLQHSEKVLSMQDTDESEPAKMEEVLEVVTAAKLMTEVVTTVAPITTAAQVPKASAPRRRREPKPLKGQAQIDMDEAFARQLEAELNANINWNDVIELVKRSEKQDNTVMRYQALKRKPVIEAQTMKNMMIYLKNMAGFKMNFFKGVTYNEIRRLFEKHYNFNQAFLERVDKEVTVQEKEIKEEGSKRKGKIIKQKISKKQSIDEEAEELKRHLQIVANDDDDVYTEATPLASKNFDREDLETFWKLVKERFESTEPKNFSDDFLLNILKIMFEKRNVEANVWRDQRADMG
nr:hypothetical protein [Tanacetum cinerariifolium]